MSFMQNLKKGLFGEDDGYDQVIVEGQNLYDGKLLS